MFSDIRSAEIIEVQDNLFLVDGEQRMLTEGGRRGGLKGNLGEKKESYVFQHAADIPLPLTVNHRFPPLPERGNIVRSYLHIRGKLSHQEF